MNEYYTEWGFLEGNDFVEFFHYHHTHPLPPPHLLPIVPPPLPSLPKPFSALDVEKILTIKFSISLT